MSIDKIAASEQAALKAARLQLDAATADLQTARAKASTTESAAIDAQDAFGRSGSDADASKLQAARAELARVQLWIERAEKLLADAQAAVDLAQTEWQTARAEGLAALLHSDATLEPLITAFERSIRDRLELWGQVQAVAKDTADVWAALCEVTSKQWRNERGLRPRTDAHLMDVIRTAAASRVQLSGDGLEQRFLREVT